MLGRMVTQPDRLQQVTTNVYDNAGNLESIQDAEGNTTTYDYDVLGRKTLTTYADNKSERIDYDELGRMLFVQTYGPNEDKTIETIGVRREYFYEFSGVVDKIKFTNFRSPSSSFDHDFSYDNDFDLYRTASVNTGNNVGRTFTYTDRGRLKSEQLDYNTTSSSNPMFNTNYTYNHEGRVETIQYPSAGPAGKIVAYDYNDRGQLETVTWDSSLLETRAYDPAGRMDTITRAKVNESRTYDNANRLLTIWNDDPSNSSNSDDVGKLNYTYDENGNKTAESWSAGPTAMQDWNFTIPNYDAEDRFLGFVRSGSLAKDLTYIRTAPTGASGTIGNIKTTTDNLASPSVDVNRLYSSTYELLDPDTALSNDSQVYNEEGQLIHSHTGHDITWDASGRLSEVLVDSNDTAGIEGTWQYGYDCDNRRVWKKKQGADTFTIYAYGGRNCISEITIDTSQSTDTAEIDQEFVYGTTIDELLFINLPTTIDRTTAKQLGVTRNQQWSVMAIYDFVSGNIEQRYNYDPFGIRHLVNVDGTFTPTSTDQFEVPYGYTSRRHDPESDRGYFRARYFEFGLGQFNSLDPWKYRDGMSLYDGRMYPNGMDPTGNGYVSATTYWTGGKRD